MAPALGQVLVSMTNLLTVVVDNMVVPHIMYMAVTLHKAELVIYQGEVDWMTVLDDSQGLMMAWLVM